MKIQITFGNNWEMMIKSHFDPWPQKRLCQLNYWKAKQVANFLDNCNTMLISFKVVRCLISSPSIPLSSGSIAWSDFFSCVNSKLPISTVADTTRSTAVTLFIRHSSKNLKESESLTCDLILGKSHDSHRFKCALEFLSIVNVRQCDVSVDQESILVNVFQ